MVGQEPTLFARSILDNILYGLDKMISPQADNSSEYDAIEAAKMANAHCFVEELKQQYQTGVYCYSSKMFCYWKYVSLLQSYKFERQNV